MAGQNSQTRPCIRSSPRPRCWKMRTCAERITKDTFLLCRFENHDVAVDTDAPLVVSEDNKSVGAAQSQPQHSPSDQSHKPHHAQPGEQVTDPRVDCDHALGWDVGDHQSFFGIELVYRRQDPALIVRCRR